ncbi:MAG: phosphoribosylanthranilate isomerase, partial [Alphaproteobacteria bacterium]
MSIEVKICGVNSSEALAAAVEGGADYVGFAFYPRSPRNVTPQAAQALAAQAPERVVKVGLAVDLDDTALAAILEAVPLGLWQLHGAESPERVAEIKQRFGLPVMKVVKIAELADVAAAEAYLRVADRLLFDAKPPKEMTGALPGGNALTFDWQLLAGKTWPIPWMLSGGLDPANVAEAARISGARAVDV